VEQRQRASYGTDDITHGHDSIVSIVSIVPVVSITSIISVFSIVVVPHTGNRVTVEPSLKGGGTL